LGDLQKTQGGVQRIAVHQTHRYERLTGRQQRISAVGSGGVREWNHEADVGDCDRYRIFANLGLKSRLMPTQSKSWKTGSVPPSTAELPTPKRWLDPDSQGGRNPLQEFSIVRTDTRKY